MLSLPHSHASAISTKNKPLTPFESKMSNNISIPAFTPSTVLPQINLSTKLQPQGPSVSIETSTGFPLILILL